MKFSPEPEYGHDTIIPQQWKFLHCLVKIFMLLQEPMPSQYKDVIFPLRNSHYKDKLLANLYSGDLYTWINDLYIEMGLHRIELCSLGGLDLNLAQFEL